MEEGTHTYQLEKVPREIFPTSVSDEKIQQAKEKSNRRIFGSSQIFLNAEDKHLQCRPYSFHDIVQEKVNEHYERGMKSFSQREWEDAVISFTKAINLDPDRGEMYLRRAEAYLQLCDFQSASLNLQKACSIIQPNEEYLELLAFIYYLQGQCLFERECYLDALESFTRSSELQPLNKMYHMRSICCLAALGRHGECIRLVTKRLEEERGNPDLYIVRARLYDHLNQATLCYHDVQRARSLDPQHPVAITMQEKLMTRAEEAKGKAVNHTVEGQLQEALKKICLALEFNPSSAEYHIFRGMLFRKLKDFSPSVDDLIMAMTLCSSQNPKEIQLRSEAEEQLHLTYNDFAVHCYSKGFYQEGVQLLNKALDGEQSKKELYVNRGDCLFQLGELNFAMADYQQALELDAANWGIRTRVATLLDVMGCKAQQSRQYQQADIHFSEAIQHQPLLPQLFQHRAQARRCLLSSLEAQIDAVISILLHPNSDEALLTVMNFFPGKTLEEILSSKLAEAARYLLNKSLKELPVEWREYTQSFGKQELEASVSSTPGAKEDVNTCLSDRQLVAQLISTRRKLNSDIQKVLNRRSHLQSSAPRPQKISQSKNRKKKLLIAADL